MRSHLAVFLALLCCGCESTVQTTSGEDYRLARPGFDPGNGTAMDLAVDKAAQIAPLLRFPAKIGLARIQYGALQAVPPREADAWSAFAKAHGDYGTFVPISPLIADMAAGVSGDVAKTVVDRIRLGAARQHVDAVLIYTVAYASTDKISPLSLLDLTIVGAYLVPSRSIRGEATATALLLDVRNGYPYGTATTDAHQGGFVPSIGSRQESQDLAQDAEVDAVGKLTAELDPMLSKLRNDLQTRELALLRNQGAVPSQTQAATP
jgi:hypothetical protein